MADLTPDDVREKVKKFESLKGMDLSNINLSDTNLRGVDLRSANLNHADLSSADLRSANLRDADLSNTTLINVDLREADLSHADLSCADIVDSVLCLADLSHSDLSHADLTNTTFTGANLSNADLNGVDLEYANLTNTDISGANIFHFTTHGWMIEGIKCTHVYNHPDDASEEDRKKSRIDFKEGEFEARYKIMPTIELVLSGGLRPEDQYKMYYIINKANIKYNAGLEISSMKKGFKGIEVMLEAKSDKDLEEIGHMIVREYKNRNLDNELLAIIKKEKLLCGGDKGSDINKLSIVEPKKFRQLAGASITIVNKGTINIFKGDVKGDVVAIGQCTKEITIIKNYANNKDTIDKVLREFKEQVSTEVQQQIEELRGALKKKSEKEALGAWKKIKKVFAKADKIMKTGEKAATLSQRAIELFHKLDGWF